MAKNNNSNPSPTPLEALQARVRSLRERKKALQMEKPAPFLNVRRLREEAQEKERENKLQRALGLQLINIGYKVLATKLHPDKGGSPEAMARLNRIRNTLREAL